MRNKNVHPVHMVNQAAYLTGRVSSTHSLRNGAMVTYSPTKLRNTHVVA